MLIKLALKRIKYIAINYKTLMREIKDDLNKWEKL